MVRATFPAGSAYMSNETIFREVDEELRGERMRTMWRRFGPFVIGGAVAIVLVVAVNEGWSWWQNANAARSSDQFYAALELAEAGDVAAAQEALNAVAAEATGDYPTLARFRQASLLAGEGQTAEAIAAYDALATSETNPRLREMALVLAGYLLVDGGDVAAVRQRVGGLASPENPMRNAAREAIGLAHYQAGDLRSALATFEEVIADPGVGQDLASRVQVYVAQLQAMGAADPDRPAAAEPDADAAAEPAADAAVEEAAPVGVPAGEASAEPVADDEPTAAEQPAAAAAESAPAADPAADTESMPPDADDEAEAINPAPAADAGN